MMIDAVENARDAGEDLATLDVHAEAIGYLDDSALCICKPLPRDHAHNVGDVLTPCESLAHCPSVCDCPAGTCEATASYLDELSEDDLDLARAVNAAMFAPRPVPSCWCDEPAAVLVTVDPYCSTPTHTITVSGFEGEPAIAVCDQHAASMSGAVCPLDGGVDGWAR